MVTVEYSPKTSTAVAPRGSGGVDNFAYMWKTL